MADAESWEWARSAGFDPEKLAEKPDFARVAAEDRHAEVALRGEEHVVALEQEANRGLSSLTADQLAEKARAGIGECDVEDGEPIRDEGYDALAELVRRCLRSRDDRRGDLVLTAINADRLNEIREWYNAGDRSGETFFGEAVGFLLAALDAAEQRAADARVEAKWRTDLWEAEKNRADALEAARDRSELRLAAAWRKQRDKRKAAEQERDEERDLRVRSVKAERQWFERAEAAEKERDEARRQIVTDDEMHQAARVGLSERARAAEGRATKAITALKAIIRYGEREAVTFAETGRIARAALADLAAEDTA